LFVCLLILVCLFLCVCLMFFIICQLFCISKYVNHSITVTLRASYLKLLFFVVVCLLIFICLLFFFVCLCFFFVCFFVLSYDSAQNGKNKSCISVHFSHKLYFKISTYSLPVHFHCPYHYFHLLFLFSFSQLHL